MSIAFKCTTCGRGLKANPEMSGKKTKCPGCATVLTIPADSAHASASDTGKPVASQTMPTAGAILTCDSCGTKVRSKPEWAGKAIKCPKCQEKIKVPGMSPSAIAAAPARTAPKKPAPPPPDDDDPFGGSGMGGMSDEPFGDDEDAPVSTPARKAKAEAPKKKSRVWMLLVLAVVLIVICDAAAWAFLDLGLTAMLMNQPASLPGPVLGAKKNQDTTGDDKDDEMDEKEGTPKKSGKFDKAEADDKPGGALALVPANGVAFAMVRPQAMFKTDAGKKLLAKLEESADGGKFAKHLAKEFSVSATDILEIVVAFTEVPMGGNPADSQVLIVQTAKPINSDGFEADYDGVALEKKDVGNKSYFVNSQQKTAFYHCGPHTLIFGSEQRVLPFVKAAPARNGPLAATLKEAAAGNHLIFVGFRVPPEIAKMKAMAPAEAKAFLPLAEANLGRLTVADDRGLKIVAKLSFPDAEKAKSSVEPLNGLLALAGFGIPKLKEMAPPEAAKIVKALEDGLGAIKPTVAGNTLEIPLNLDITLDAVVEMIGPMVDKLQGSAKTAVGFNNMKQLGMAMHNYHDVNKFLPEPKLGINLSWRVAVLPYIEQENLFKAFDQSEPWDGPRNKKLLTAMPKVFEHPTRKAPPGYTYFRVFAGPTALFEEGKKATLRGINDGSILTLMIVEAADAVPWTKSDELIFVPNGPLPKLGDPAKNGEFLAVMADAAAYRLREIDETTLRALVTASGGEKVDYKILQR